MISVLHEPENRLSAYGLNRFISKFGLERGSGGKFLVAIAVKGA